MFDHPLLKMNKIIRLLTLGIAFTTITALARAQFNYSTDFSSTNYQQGNALPSATDPNQQNGWYVDPVSADPQSAFAAVITNNNLYLGGYFLTNANATPASNLNFAKVGTALNTNSVRFQTTFFITPSTVGSSDSFGWEIFNNAGYQLMSIDLNYTSGTSYTLGVTSFANDTPTNTSGVPVSQVLNGTNGSPLSPLSSSTQYVLAFSIYNIGTTNQSVSAFSYNAGTNNPPLFLGNTSIAGTDFSTSDYNNGDTNIATFAAYWNTADTNTYGNNSLAMSNVSISSVPEPKTWILLGLSGLVVVVTLRRRVSK